MVSDLMDESLVLLSHLLCLPLHSMVSLGNHREKEEVKGRSFSREMVLKTY